MPFSKKHSILFISMISVAVLLFLFLCTLFITKKKKTSLPLAVQPANEEEATVKQKTEDNHIPSVIPASPVIIPPCIKKDRPVILIAEDNEANYLLLKSILNKEYTLIWVQNGQEAVKCAHEQNIDLILMDIKMPKMNGIEALQEIRKTYPNLPIVMQTAHAFEADKIKTQQAGCSDFLTKPITPHELKLCISKFMPEPMTVS